MNVYNVYLHTHTHSHTHTSFQCRRKEAWYVQMMGWLLHFCLPRMQAALRFGGKSSAADAAGSDRQGGAAAEGVGGSSLKSIKASAAGSGDGGLGGSAEGGLLENKKGLADAGGCSLTRQLLTLGLPAAQV